jgi:hypothetical protein
VEDPVLPRQFLVSDVQKTKIHLPYPRRKNDASSGLSSKIHLPYPRRKNDASSGLSSLSGRSVLINRRMK